MTQEVVQRVRLRLSRASRIIKSDDFARILQGAPRKLRLSHDIVSISALPIPKGTRVRIGVTVGKHNVARSVDRALAKRVLRENARVYLPEFRRLSARQSCGLDINLRIKTKLGAFGRDIPLQGIKQRIHQASQQCLRTLIERCLRSGDVSC